MKKLHLLAVTTVAVFALGSIAASSAFASAEWLVNGSSVTGEDEVTTPITLSLITLAGGFLEPESAVLCHGKFVGDVLAGGTSTITSLENSAGEVTSEAKPLICEGTKACEKVVDVEFWVLHLPWTLNLELMEPKAGENIYLLLLLRTIIYIIVCLVFGVSHQTLCEGETSAVLKNLGTGSVEDVFTPSELIAEKLEMACFEGTTEHKEVAVQEGKGETTLAFGGKLEASG